MVGARLTARVAVFATVAAAVAIVGQPAVAAGSARVSLVGATIRYDASQGHINNTYVEVVVEPAGTIVYRFSDVYPITTALPCASSRPGMRYQLECRFAPSNTADVHVRLFDGDDKAKIEEIRAAGAPSATGVVRVEGGSGNDQIWMDHISGSAGWPDIVDGGYGDDLIVADKSDDIFYGGPGNDTVSYSQRLTGVTASLAAGEGGEVRLGERDTYDGVENLEGGWTLTPVEGQDVLVGDAHANRLTSRGPAVLFGLAGDDTLRGGHFGGHLFGGPGMDTLYGGLGDDHLGGGTEFDVCVPGSGADDLTDCELIIAPPPGP